MTDRGHVLSVRVSRRAPRRLLVALVAIHVVLGLLTLAGEYVQQHYALGKAARYAVRFVHVDHERNLAAWYSGGVLLLAATLCAVIPALAGIQTAVRRRYWYLLALALAAMSLDELVELHDRVEQVWASATLAAVAIFGCAMIPLLRGVPARTRLLFIAGGAMFVAGSLGVDIFGTDFAYKHGPEPLGYQLLAVAEELLEGCGVATFVYGLLDYMLTSASAAKASARSAVAAADGTEPREYPVG